MWTSASWCCPSVFLERFEPFHVLPAGSVGQQTAETLDQIAQLLGVLAETVDVLGRRVGCDQSTVIDERLVGSGDPPGDGPAERLIGSSRQRFGAVEWLGEPATPLGHQRSCLLGSSTPASS